MGSKYLLHGIQGSSKTNILKLTYLVANIEGLVTAQLPPIFIFMTKENSIWSKALIMSLAIWNCVLSYKQKNYFSENRLVLPRNYFITEIPRDFQVTNLLLATVNFEP